MWKNVPIREEYWEQLRKAAEDEGRSIANYLENQLIEKKVVKKLEEIKN